MERFAFCTASTERNHTVSMHSSSSGSGMGVVDRFPTQKCSCGAPAIPAGDGAHERVSHIRNVTSLELPDPAAELFIAKDILDPAVKVPASEMTLNDIVWNRRQHRKQIA